MQPLLPTPWINVNKSYLVEGAPALTMDSLLTYYHFVVISITSLPPASEDSVEEKPVTWEVYSHSATPFVDSDGWHGALAYEGTAYKSEIFNSDLHFAAFKLDGLLSGDFWSVDPSAGDFTLVEGSIGVDYSTVEAGAAFYEGDIECGFTFLGFEIEVTLGGFAGGAGIGGTVGIIDNKAKVKVFGGLGLGGKVGVSIGLAD